MILRMLIIWMLFSVPTGLVCSALQTGPAVGFAAGLIITGLGVVRFQEWFKGSNP